MPALAQRPKSIGRRIKRASHSRHKRRNGDLPDLVSAMDWGADAAGKPPVSIALIDPKPLTRQSMIEMLKNWLPAHVTLLGASSYDELLGDADETGEAEAAEDEPQLVVLYVRSASVADTWVQGQLALIRRRQSGLPVIMISDRDDPEDVLTALKWGVRGYIPTSIAAEVAVAALNFVDAGGTYIPVSALNPGTAEPRPEIADDVPARLMDELRLTARELSVIELLREGKPNKLIATELDMQESTVKVHVRNILKKLHVSNRTHAALVANRLLAEPGNHPGGRLA